MKTAINIATTTIGIALIGAIGAMTALAFALPDGAFIWR